MSPGKTRANLPINRLRNRNRWHHSIAQPSRQVPTQTKGAISRGQPLVTGPLMASGELTKLLIAQVRKGRPNSCNLGKKRIFKIQSRRLIKIKLRIIIRIEAPKADVSPQQNSDACPISTLPDRILSRVSDPTITNFAV